MWGEPSSPFAYSKHEETEGRSSGGTHSPTGCPSGDVCEERAPREEMYTICRPQAPFFKFHNKYRAVFGRNVRVDYLVCGTHTLWKWRGSETQLQKVQLSGIEHKGTRWKESVWQMQRLRKSWETKDSKYFRQQLLNSNNKWKMVRGGTYRVQLQNNMPIFDFVVS